MALSDGVHRVAQTLLYNRTSMLYIECQVTFSVPMYFYYLCCFGLTSNSQLLCLKIAYGISVLSFIGTFAELRNATICFMSVSPSAWNISAPNGRNFVKFDVGVFFEEMSRQFKFH